MKILYAIQGTGNGHITRARDIVPLLLKKGEVDIVVSGSHTEVALGYPIKYRLQGLGFIFGKGGGIDLLGTYKKNNLKQFWKEVKALPVQDYDMVINDFEPVSAWACYLQKKPCLGLSHQAAVANKKAPKPKKKDVVGNTILKFYAPTTEQYGFHFNAYDTNIFTPVIRQQVRDLVVTNNSHYTVYLPAYSDKKILKVLSLFKEEKFYVFSKHNKKPFVQGNISFLPLNNEAFIQSMASGKGVLCGAGFETPAEALFLQKKLMVIPMKGQYEQQCNAAALKEMGIPVIKNLKKKHAEKIEEWLQSEQVFRVNYPNITAEIIDEAIENYPIIMAKLPAKFGKNLSDAKGLKNFILKKLFTRIAG
jgi:uncharacterized protein (TIGR00661 family)